MSDLVKPTEQIIDRLDLQPAKVDEVKQEIRYAAASLTWELTKLEGAQI